MEDIIWEDEQDGKAIELAFNKKKIEARKNWLRHFEKVDYADATRNKCELDERVFINEEDSLLASGSLSGGAMNISGAKRKIDSITSPAKTITTVLSHYGSPSASQRNGIPCTSNSNPAGTPVTTAMPTAKWLRTVISPLPRKPALDLERFLSSCDRDVTSDVTCRANIILEAIFPSNGLGDRAELVLATHKTLTMLFPAVLERTGITAFGLTKVTESFIRHEESLRFDGVMLIFGATFPCFASMLSSSERYDSVQNCLGEMILTSGFQELSSRRDATYRPRLAKSLHLQGQKEKCGHRRDCAQSTEVCWLSGIPSHHQ
ncbi:hypothetical protein RHMOL_Rhmol05G0211000 [Rhododendron molle]|uniref:Uncharacterized protein n=1 Tax=Rhododendron molle TaxID=49168 RepID=A0ACC0NT24_RHOML|nr:hypothetical protein RHMOL_Rhmol05G0211000 [Rhododendron molle]